MNITHSAYSRQPLWTCSSHAPSGYIWTCSGSWPILNDDWLDMPQCMWLCLQSVVWSSSIGSYSRWAAPGCTGSQTRPSPQVDYSLLVSFHVWVWLLWRSHMPHKQIRVKCFLLWNKSLVWVQPKTMQVPTNTELQDDPWFWPCMKNGLSRFHFTDVVPLPDGTASGTDRLR